MPTISQPVLMGDDRGSVNELHFENASDHSSINGFSKGSSLSRVKFSTVVAPRLIGRPF